MTNSLKETIVRLTEIKQNQVFSKAFLSSEFDADELLIQIEEEIKYAKCDFQMIHLLCSNVFNETRKKDYNPVYEDIFIKQGFLMECLDIPAIIFEALVLLIGNTPELAYRLDFCVNNEPFQYFLKMYKNYIEQFNSIYTIAKEFSNVDKLINEGNRAEELVAKMKELTAKTE